MPLALLLCSLAMEPIAVGMIFAAVQPVEFELYSEVLVIAPFAAIVVFAVLHYFHFYHWHSSFHSLTSML